MKTKSTKTLRKKLWTIFSQYIRQRDKGVCFTCGDRRHWKEQQAGHFIHKDCLDYNEKNINCQCVRCNKWLSGNLGEYALKLVKKYGIDEVNELRRLGHQVRKFGIIELEKMIEHYKQKLEELQ